jgi:hypothetical protein
MRKHTTESDGRADQRIQLLVATDRELQVAGCDALDFEVLRGVAGELKDFGGEVLEDSGDVNGGFGANAHFVLGLRFEETLDATARELGCRCELACGAC